MRKQSFRQNLITSVACTTVMAIMIACGGASKIGITGPGTGTPGNPAAAAVKRIVSSAMAGMHIYKSESGVNTMALFTGFAATPAQLQQSFLGKCNITLTSIPSGFMVPLVTDRGDENNCNNSFSNAQPNRGSIVITDGTIGTLIVTADTGDNTSTEVCTDLTNTAPVSDKQFVSAWFRPSDNAVLLFQGTTQLPVTCNVPVGPGQSVVHISAQFNKS